MKFTVFGQKLFCFVFHKGSTFYLYPDEKDITWDGLVFWRGPRDIKEKGACFVQKNEHSPFAV